MQLDQDVIQEQNPKPVKDHEYNECCSDCTLLVFDDCSIREYFATHILIYL